MTLAVALRVKVLPSGNRDVAITRSDPCAGSALVATLRLIDPP